MPKVSINIIKDWFKNQSKPPQEQFWTWLDSFWHKDEPIPQSAVQNLVPTLQKKADLVNGVVPENQLPFSALTSEIISLGDVSVVGNKTNLAVHSSGANKVRVKGPIITRTFPNQWTITPVVADGTKVLRGYAVKGELDFFLAEGPELPEIVDPEIPEGALELFKITMNLGGATVVVPNEAYKLQSSDNWKLCTIPNNDPFTIQMDNSFAARFEIKLAPGVTAPKIGLVRQKAGKSFWNGSQFTFWNNSDIDIELIEETYTDTIFKNLTFEPATIKAGNYAQIFEKAGVLVVGKFSDALKLDKPPTPNNVSTRVVNADNSTSDKGDFQQSAQIEISANTPATDAMKGKEIWVTASCTLTIPLPSTLSAEWNIDILVFPSVTLTLAITSPGTWLHTTPGTVTDAFFRIARRGNTTTFKTLGL